MCHVPYHEAITKAPGCTVYFADPFCSVQKNGVENVNKTFREFYPKGTNFRLIYQRDLD